MNELPKTPDELQALLERLEARKIEVQNPPVRAPEVVSTCKQSEGPVFCPKCHQPVVWVKRYPNGGMKVTQGERVMVDMPNVVCRNNTFTFKCSHGHEVNVG